MLEASDRLDKTCREAPGMFCVLALGAVDDGAEVDDASDVALEAGGKAHQKGNIESGG